MNPPGVALEALNRALAGLLALDPETLARLAPFDGRRVGVEVRGAGLAFHIVPGRAGIRIEAAPDAEPDALIRGAPLALLGMLSREDRDSALFSGDVEIRGDVRLVQRLHEVVRELDIDTEELLSRLVGDIAAHRIGVLARRAAAWARTVREDMVRNAGEYLREESGMVPSAAEVEDYLGGVDRLRSDAERLQQRVERLLRASDGAPADGRS